MLVTLPGIVTEVKPLQPEKAPYSMLVTLLGIVTEVRLVHSAKSLAPMLVTLLGIVTEVRPLQLLNILNHYCPRKSVNILAKRHILNSLTIV